jgi:hypothetical protein
MIMMILPSKNRGMEKSESNLLYKEDLTGLHNNLQQKVKKTQREELLQSNEKSEYEDQDLSFGARTGKKVS